MNCSTSVTTFPVSNCSGESDSNSATDTCRNFNATQATKALVLDGPVMSNGGSCGIGGTSARSGTSWAASSVFCQASSVGGGCAPGRRGKAVTDRGPQAVGRPEPLGGDRRLGELVPGRVHRGDEVGEPGQAEEDQGVQDERDGRPHAERRRGGSAGEGEPDHGYPHG